MTVRQGSSAWLWKITARSSDGPTIAWLSTTTTPSEGSSRPAKIFSTVVLPQPEWPMTQTNWPRAIENHRFSNTVDTLPPASGKRRAMPSIEMKRSPISSLRKGDEPCEAGEDLVEHHADDADHENRGDHVGDGEVIPLVPDEVADPGAADEHFGGDDDEPGNADRNAHAGQNRGRRRRQDNGEGPTDRGHLERTGDIQPFAPHRGDPEGGVDQHRPNRADEDHKDGGDRGILDGIERERHPGERRNRLQDLDERIERAIHQRRHADQKSDRDRGQQRDQVADEHARERIAELNAEPFVVRPVVVERALQMFPDFRSHIEGAGHGRLSRG